MDTIKAIDVIEKTATAALKAGLFSTLGDAAICDAAIIHLKTLVNGQVLQDPGGSDKGNTSSRQPGSTGKKRTTKKEKEAAGTGNGSAAKELIQSVFPGVEFPPKSLTE